jgi:hypothetical protein
MERYKYITVEGWKYYTLFIGLFVMSIFALFGAVMLVYVWVCGLEYAAVETMKAFCRSLEARLILSRQEH